MRPRSTWGLVLVATTGCARLFGLEEPQRIDSGLDPDGIVADTPPGTVCYGTGLEKVCLTAAPTGMVQLAGALDTDGSMCLASVVSITTPACVIAGAAVTVSGSVVATGSRPLVIVTTGDFNVPSLALLDASSARGRSSGAGASPACTGGAPPVGLGGGAGGSLATIGGIGGGVGGNPGGIPADQIAVTALRGGCPGGNGGGSAIGGGPGGGALWIISTTSIEIAGTVNASGAGGAGGAFGGAGGGSGGMIGLDAPAVITRSGARVFANGGGGGEGAKSAESGVPGRESPAPTVAGAGGMNGSNEGGDGGDGAYVGHDARPGMSAQTTAGGGGGGGGGGMVLIYGEKNVAAGTVSPLPP